MNTEILFSFEHPIFGSSVTINESTSTASARINYASKNGDKLAEFTRKGKSIYLDVNMISGVQTRAHDSR